VRARRRDDPAEAARATDVHGRAVRLTGSGEPSRAGRLNNLAGALRLSAGLSGDQDVLRRALTAYRQALDATPASSPDRGAILANLGNGLLDRASATGSPAELDEAVAALTQAVQGTAPAAPEFARQLCNLAHALRARHERTASPRDRHRAADLYRQSCRLAAQTSPEVELIAGRSWGMWALDRRAWDEAAEALGHAASATERLARTQLTRQATETWLTAAVDVSPAAAFAAATLGQRDAAVVYLEQGRGRLLSETLRRTRADLDELRHLRPALARAYQVAADRVSALESAAKEEPMIRSGKLKAGSLGGHGRTGA
jgi:tetratricopeptide (TPR) repeat protein